MYIVVVEVEPTFTVRMTSTSSGNYHETSRTWTHIKVLYILNIVLAAVVLALFVVCFMMLLDVQRSHNNEVKLRKVSWLPFYIKP